MTNAVLIPTLKALQATLALRGIAHLAVFGSAARGKARPDSDVDLLITPEPGRRLDLIELGGVVTIVSEALGRPVDVVTAPVAPPELDRAIIRDAVPVF